MPQLLLPYVYGTIFGCADQKQTLTTVWAHVGGYLSTSLLLLAVLGLLSRGRRGLRLALLVWIVLALARMYGLPLLGDMLGVVPGISDVLFYRYAFASVELSVIILAALAVDDLVRAPMPRRRLAVGALAAFALVAAAAIGARPLANQLGPVFGDRPYYEAAVAWGAIVVLAAVVAALLRDARARAGTVILLVAVDAMVLFAIPQLSAPRNVRIDRAPVAFLERGRISATRASSPWGPFQPNDGSYFGVASLNINDVPVPSVFTDYVRTRLDSVADPKLLVGNYGGGRPLFAPSPQQELIRNLEGYRAASVRYVLAPPNAPLPTSGSTFTLVFRSPSTWIYRLSGSVLLHGEGMHREARRARVRTAHLSRPNDARAARGRLPGLERACRRRISAGAPGRRPVPGGAGRRPAPTGSNSATCRQRPSGDSSLRDGLRVDADRSGHGQKAPTPTDLRWGPPVLRSLAVARPLVAAAGALLALGGAPAGAAHPAETPSEKALYEDSPDGRYLLGGRWLYRADPGDTGIAEGFQRERTTRRWRPRPAFPTQSTPATSRSGASTARSPGIGRNSGLPRWTGDSAGPSASVAQLSRARVAERQGSRGPTRARTRPSNSLRAESSGTASTRLVVRVDSRRVDTDVPPRLALSWNWGGILGKVYVRRVGPLDIESAQVIPRLHNRNQRARSRMFELHDIQLLIDDLHRVVITLRRR